MKTKKFTTTQLTMLGLMAAVLLLMAYTPLGYLNIGPLAISFNVIPVAISAVVLGPTGGAIAGAILDSVSDLAVQVQWELCYLASIRFWHLSRDLCHVFLTESALAIFTRLCVRRQMYMYHAQ